MGTGPLIVPSKCKSGRVWRSPGAISGFLSGNFAGPQVQILPDLASEGVLRLCSPSQCPLPPPESIGLRRVIIHGEHHQGSPSAEYSSSSHRYFWIRYNLGSEHVSKQ
ncbi:unnamed protein product [Lepeophtheirus salmonis]|uniref:(salmon louse) hypothetical protein n=1 Tax=Lepeophtheirus salmonis TaxID=72036 RepID=A0A817F8J7_LEPSM|nr:unnamed protein product [Lepeophtheirus salmonis]CAG9475288.1 unnamed protein product [Lepeophtheirus salmonis]